MGDLASGPSGVVRCACRFAAWRCSTPKTARCTARSKTCRVAVRSSACRRSVRREPRCRAEARRRHGWVSAHTVRIEAHARTALADRGAVRSRRRSDARRDRRRDRACAARRSAPPDPRDRRSSARRVELATRLAARGMTPLAPRTPLEAIDLLTRTQLHVNVCLLAPSFGQTRRRAPRARLRQLPVGDDRRDLRRRRGDRRPRARSVVRHRRGADRVRNRVVDLTPLLHVGAQIARTSAVAHPIYAIAIEWS